MDNKTVLITSVGTVTSQSVIKGLVKQGDFKVKIIGINSDELAAGKYFCDSFYKVPLANEKNYLDEIIKIIKKERVDLLIPIHDRELPIIARNHREFEKNGCKAVISNLDTIEKCNSKYKSYEFFSKEKILTPLTFKEKEANSAYDELKFPLILKPNFGVSSKDIYTPENKEEAEIIKKKIDKPIFQELIKGEEYTIDVLNDFQGNTISVVPRKRLETKEGVSYKSITVKDDYLIKMGQEISEKLKINGHCNIQCFKTSTGQYYFFEINPRFSGTFAHTLEAGLNSPLLLMKMAAGHKVEPRIGIFKDGLTMLRYWDEIFVDKYKKVRKNYYKLKNAN